MNIKFTLPQWKWIDRLMNRCAPNSIQRASIHGKAKASRRWLNGIIEIDLEVEAPNHNDDWTQP